MARPPHRLVVVVNYWGGVPKALHANVVADLSAAVGPPLVDVVHAATLPSTDPHSAFESCVILQRSPIPYTVFHAAQRAGFRTVVLGAHGLASTPLGPDSVADPRRVLSEWGVDRCSPSDGAVFRGDGRVHDAEVFAEAERLVRDWRRCDGEARWEQEEKGRQEGASGLLLFLNLIAYRNVRHSADWNRADAWRRMVPRDVLAARPPWRRTEESSPPQDDSSVREYAARLGYGMAVHRDAQAMLLHSTRFLLSSIDEQDPDSAPPPFSCLCTHSLSLGEHGTRHPPLPTATYATGFFGATTTPVAGPATASTTTMRDRLLLFLIAACDLGDRARPSPSTAVTLVDGDTRLGLPPLARLECSVHDRRYSCVFRPPTGRGERTTEADVLAVYDLDSDTGETEDVWPALCASDPTTPAGILSAIPVLPAVAAPRPPTPAAPVVASALLPSLPALPSASALPSTPTLPPTLAVRSPGMTTTPAASEHRRLGGTSQRAAAGTKRNPVVPSLRTREARLNTQHR